MFLWCRGGSVKPRKETEGENPRRPPPKSEILLNLQTKPNPPGLDDRRSRAGRSVAVALRFCGSFVKPGVPSIQTAADREGFPFPGSPGCWATWNGRDHSLISGFSAHFHNPSLFKSKGQKSSPKTCSRTRKGLEACAVPEMVGPTFGLRTVAEQPGGNQRKASQKK